MNSPPASSYLGERGGDLGHLHERQDALMHAGATATAADDHHRQPLLGCTLNEPRQPFADDRAHRAHDERRVGDADRHSPGADHAGAGQHGVLHAGPLLLGDDPLGVRLLVGEAERVERREVGVPLLEGAVVDHVPDAVAGAEVHVPPAGGAHVHLPLDFLAEDGFLALLAAQEQAAGDAPLRARAAAVGRDARRYRRRRRAIGRRPVGRGAGRVGGGVGGRHSCFSLADGSFAYHGRPNHRAITNRGFVRAPRRGPPAGRSPPSCRSRRRRPRSRPAPAAAAGGG